MNIKGRISGIIRFTGLIIMVFLCSPLSAQQSGSPPVIRILTPSAADSLNNTGVITVSAEIISSTPLQAIRIVNNSQPVVNEANLKPEKKDENTYVISSFVPLKRGLNSVSVEASNPVGNTRSETRVINSHLEPFVTWLAPEKDNENIESGVVTLKAEIKTVYPLQNLIVSVNGTTSQREAGGAVAAGEYTLIFEKRIQLRPGKNLVYLTADNGKGTTRSMTRTINFGVPPQIRLESPPAPDSLNSTGIVTVIAEISSSTPVQSYKIFHNGTVVLDGRGMTPEKKDSVTSILSSNLPLKRGLNTIYVEAKNAIGTSTSDKRTINSRSEPFVTWLEPGADNMNSRTGTMNIRAEIKTAFPLQNLQTTLNGSVISSDLNAGVIQNDNNTYIFEKSIPLKSGKNLVYISAGNMKGITRSLSRTINFGSAPVISLLRPSSSDSLNTSGVALVRAEIISYIPLNTYRIINNDIAAADETALQPSQKDSITYVIESNVPLRKGSNVLYVEARNALGTSVSGKKTIISQSEPFITWLSPAMPGSSSDGGTVNIKAEIRSFLDLGGVSLNVNGKVILSASEELKKTGEGVYLFEKTLKEELAPKNTISIIASNLRGTTISDSRSVDCSTGLKPMVTITSADSLNNSGIFLFTVEIVSETKLTAIRVIQNGTVLANESSRIPDQKDSVTYVMRSLVPLKAGLNSFYVEAKNSFGTSSSLKHSVLCKPEPIINWVSPVASSVTEGKETADIKAEIITSFDLLNTGVSLNGTLLAQDNQGLTRVANDKYILERSVPLKTGENTLVLTASNARGTGSSANRTISYVPSPEAESVIREETKPAEIISEAVIPADNKKTDEKSLPETVKTEITTVVEEKVAEPAKDEQKEVPVVAPEVPEAVAAPSVTWQSPSRERTDISQSSARIRAAVRSSGNIQSLLVYVNGVASEDKNLLSSAGNEGEFSFEKSISLRPGENSIYIIATNTGGTIRSETRYLTNPPANPPAVSWAVPSAPNTIVNNEVVLLEACIRSATELKEVKVLVNGVQQASEMMFQPPVAGDCNYRIAKSVILKEGDNSIYLIADNYAGSVTSDKRVIRYQTGMAEKRLALVIGNSNYGNSMVLRNPVNDANLIEGTLKSLGFEVIKRLDATRNTMMEAVRDFSKKLTEYNVALFYYAGHGVQVDGENYLVPTDALLNEQADCKWEAVPVNFIVEEFEKVPDNINIVILDACRNNPFRSWARGGTEGFRALNAVTGTIVGYATSENSTAADGSGANGTYTEELVKQMVVPQSISNVFINTRKNVLLRTNNLQRPQEWNMLTGDFFFKK